MVIFIVLNLMNAALNLLLKLMFIEKFLRWDNYKQEAFGVTMIVFTSIYFFGYLMWVIVMQIDQISRLVRYPFDAVAANNGAQLSPLQRKLRIPLYILKQLFIMIPAEFLDLTWVVSLLGTGFGLFNFKNSWQSTYSYRTDTMETKEVV